MKWYLNLLKDSFKFWQEDNVSSYSAALSYYTVFSLGPLLLVIISVLGLILSKSSVEANLYSQIGGLMGREGLSFIKTVINNAKRPTSGVIGTVVGLATLLLGAVGVFQQLKQSLNYIWGVKRNPTAGIVGAIRNYLLNFSMLGAIAFLVLVSLLAGAATSTMGTFFSSVLPFSSVVVELINFLVSFLVITFLFGLIFKILPDVKTRFSDVFLSAVLTSLLFTIGKTLIGIYIGRAGVSSTYGAAGSIVVLLLWIYYASQILFLGAEFSKVYTLAKVGKIIPSSEAVIERPIGAKTKRRRTQENIVVKGTAGFVTGFFSEISRKSTSRPRG